MTWCATLPSVITQLLPVVGHPGENYIVFGVPDIVRFHHQLSPASLPPPEYLSGHFFMRPGKHCQISPPTSFSRLWNHMREFCQHLSRPSPKCPRVITNSFCMAGHPQGKYDLSFPSFLDRLSHRRICSTNFFQWLLILNVTASGC